MKLKILFTIILTLNVAISQAQNLLSKKQITEDIEFLTKTLNEKSSYVYLNEYDFNTDFENYLKTLSDSTRLENFGMFITNTLAKIGDRHSSLSGIRGYDLKESLFLPFIYAPLNDRVVVLNKNQNKELEILNPKFPYLKKIDGIDINNFLQKTRPEDIKAPQETYFTYAVRDIRDIEKNYILLNKTLSKEIELTLSDSTFNNDTILTVKPINKSQRQRPWDERFEVDFFRVKDEDYNKPVIIEKLFKIKEKIAYIKIPEMVNKDEAPLLFDKVNSFMQSIQNDSEALIIDVRANSGGTRDLLYEFSKYLIHPDSIYVVNATKQRGPLPLPEDYKKSLNNRFLYTLYELDDEEQKKATEFLKNFKPIYELDENKYSEYYFGLLNGKKLGKTTFHYNKPVYILANEKTFSAASVFVSAFKDLPNIKIAGVTTDGSSGNSEWVDLPNSKLFGKISTMVSFQKNGEILDGYGTEPDIKIERDLNQVLWLSDTQLEKLKELILTQEEKTTHNNGYK
ncbi:peptidase S41-like protein [Cellulophaga sp. RHA19]|uniref:S41 family peptidase n=1 Tax=Cellulophaga sp. RHA19 TaxID=1798237 RepID=UPI000C2C7E56|nr:S41 family peptidase [Cellulophaga sp. RHA19]PKB43050.1 peptidase S41-like protein [Cellulophaga sp. RHA19]